MFMEMDDGHHELFCMIPSALKQVSDFIDGTPVDLSKMPQVLFLVRGVAYMLYCLKPILSELLLNLFTFFCLG
jgi:hypothetical protein